MPEPFITIALIRKTQGRHGEVAAQLFTDFPERFSERKHLVAGKPGAPTRQLELEHFWPHKDLIVLKFAGIDSINDAEPLIGYELQVPASERTQLDEGTFYISDLIGCSVFDVATSRLIGLVSDVQFGTGEAPVLVVKESVDADAAEQRSSAVEQPDSAPEQRSSAVEQPDSAPEQRSSAVEERGFSPASTAPADRALAPAKEHLIPFVERYIQKTDITAKRIEMLLPEGLLDL